MFVLQGFTTAQINTFDPAQAQASTTSQRAALSADQLSALSSVAGVSYSNTAGTFTSHSITYSENIINMFTPVSSKYSKQRLQLIYFKMNLHLLRS